MTVNEKYAQDSIEQQHYVHRYKNQIVAYILSLFDNYKVTVKNQLKIYGGDITNYKDKVVLSQKLKMLRERELLNIADALTNELKKYARVQLDIEYTRLREFIKEHELKNRLRKPSGIELSLFKKVEFEDGATYSLKSFLADVSKRNASDTNRLINIAYRHDGTAEDMSKQVDTAFQVNKRQYEAIISTMIGFVTSAVSSALYAGNKKLISGYQWISVMDGRTSDICLNLNERVYYYDYPELSTLGGEIYPPAHHRCRSVITPIFRSAEDLAVANDAFTGKPIKETPYAEWFSNQSATLQRDILGPTRYSMYKDGKIKITSFYSQDGRRLTLQELQLKSLAIPTKYKNYVR